MVARIYKPARTAMSSGLANTKGWVLEFTPASARGLDPLMGWTTSSDTRSQVRLRFPSKEAALDYARSREMEVVVSDPRERRPNLRTRGYGENFAFNRRDVWTH